LSRKRLLGYTLRPLDHPVSALRSLIAMFVIVSLAACSFSLPRVHRITIQQGNVMSQEMIDKLKPGMTRRQVAFIMGEPVMRNTFNDDRWDYVYSVMVPGFGTDIQRMSLFFEDDKLAYFSGDMAPTDANPTAATEPVSAAPSSG
jgi:outer membrane protein assembly factor BamE